MIPVLTLKQQVAALVNQAASLNLHTMKDDAQKAAFLEIVGKVDNQVSSVLKANTEILHQIHREIYFEKTKCMMSPQEEAQYSSLENDNCELYALHHTLMDLNSTSPGETGFCVISIRGKRYLRSFPSASGTVKDIKNIAASALNIRVESIKDLMICGKKICEDDNAVIGWKVMRNEHVVVIHDKK